jgi:D-alanyl-D-alanine carboxypeptidase
VTRSASAVLALALLVAACTSSPESPRPIGPTDPATPSPPAVDTSTTPTPEQPEGDDPFEASRTRFAGRAIDPLPLELEREMRGETWRAGCPLPLGDLALLRFNYWGFDGVIERGPMVVNARVADDVLGVFRALFLARFPIRHVALAERFRPNADPDSRGSVTASFNCRPIVTPDGPGDTFSQHSYGLAVDINSLQNPYVREDGFVRNRFARPYVDRSQVLPGMIHEGDVVVRAFAAIGWEWGGDWSGGKDYMHFSLAGR